MSDQQFAEIIARALLMVLRAMNRKYGLGMWILTRAEKRELRGLLAVDAVPASKIRELFDIG